jgi:hypothetical protein
MKQKIAITSEELRARALTIIKGLPLSPVYEIDIREHKKDRSVEQNALYWKWLTVIGNDLGETKEDLHERYKDKFLVHIYERDDPDYGAMVQTLRRIYKQGMKEQSISLHKQIVSLTSTSTATVKQMSEYMEAIEHDAASLAIRLPHPED